MYIGMYVICMNSSFAILTLHSGQCMAVCSCHFLWEAFHWVEDSECQVFEVILHLKITRYLDINVQHFST